MIVNHKNKGTLLGLVSSHFLYAKHKSAWGKQNSVPCTGNIGDVVQTFSLCQFYLLIHRSLETTLYVVVGGFLVTLPFLSELS